MHQKAFGGRTSWGSLERSPDPLTGFTLPLPPNWVGGRGRGRDKGRGREEGRKTGKEGKRGSRGGTQGEGEDREGRSEGREGEEKEGEGRGNFAPTVISKSRRLWRRHTMQ